SQMSEGMDEKVSDAIDTMNGDSSSEGAETVKLKFYIDQSRNVMVSSTLAQMINGISAGSGMQVDTHYVNKIPDELNNFFFAMVFMMMVMFSSMIPGILTGFTIKPQGSRIARAKTIALQIILAVAIAACLGFAIPRIVAWMGGYDLPIGQLTLFVGICSFGILMIAIGAMDLLGKPGVAAPLIIMFCGTAVANLPYEYLPEFWQKFVYPWEPLRFIAEGVREIIYRGGDGWNQFSSNMMWVVVIGLAFMLISLLKRRNGGLEEE
ncbi:MAG: hypothetical protein PHS19_03365, partial [Eubacteriales bacterium]|nr:hypothetical protein [Eubacteriales bacterium]